MYIYVNEKKGGEKGIKKNGIGIMKSYCKRLSFDLFKAQFTV